MIEIDRTKIPLLVVGYLMHDGKKTVEAMQARIVADFGYIVDPPFTKQEMAQIMLAAKYKGFEILTGRNKRIRQTEKMGKFTRRTK